ncbi:hypothetical protein RFM68_18615 [Mesorhizobium sp. MSK_1335]|uniref:Transposase n=1 Tax=Mesorhizobium montanum TaxID=3072323 RepID=A0ABU4ZMA6_9HYPH|nr:hypothetical protein [Mesorhizobium sp. MSK_1335]MDX8526517.1 hypothetical protein [Mesorhizobium sp. MSK_1335]
MQATIGEIFDRRHERSSAGDRTKIVAKRCLGFVGRLNREAAARNLALSPFQPAPVFSQPERRPHLDIFTRDEASVRLIDNWPRHRDRNADMRTDHAGPRFNLRAIPGKVSHGFPSGIADKTKR